MGSDPQVFVEDRSDVMRRAMPRLAVGLGGTCLLIGAVVSVVDRGVPPLSVMALLAALWLVSLMIRFDVFALQWGRRVRYELTDEEFRAYRGSTLVVSFELAAVSDWAAASSASTFEYWLGWGLWRSMALPLVLPQYSFTFRGADGRHARTVRPPALFRWSDRGGLEDVTRALIRRLGPPVNYPIDYSLEDDV